FVCPTYLWGPTNRTARSAGAEPLVEVTDQRVHADALLRHRVTLAGGHGAVLERVEVDSDAERRADLVLPPVTTADRARIVELDVPVPAQLGPDVAGDRGQVGVARQRQHRGLHRRQSPIET